MSVLTYRQSALKLPWLHWLLLDAINVKTATTVPITLHNHCKQLKTQVPLTQLPHRPPIEWGAFTAHSWTWNTQNLAKMRTAPILSNTIAALTAHDKWDHPGCCPHIAAPTSQLIHYCWVGLSHPTGTAPTEEAKMNALTSCTPVHCSSLQPPLLNRLAFQNKQKQVTIYLNSNFIQPYSQ